MEKKIAKYSNNGIVLTRNEWKQHYITALAENREDIYLIPKPGVSNIKFKLRATKVKD